MNKDNHDFSNYKLLASLTWRSRFPSKKTKIEKIKKRIVQKFNPPLTKQTIT